jgi:hypothetical protein
MKTRRMLIKSSLLAGASVFLPNINFSKQLDPVDTQGKPAPLPAEMVLDFVRSAHSNLPRVKELLEKEPGLLNSSWDWGGGDFETGLNGAGHTGQIEIAHYLLAKGARMDLFCAAMLGKLDIVKSILDNFPDLKSSKGPHGLMLLHHAKKGGEAAQPVLKYLNEIGAS